MKKTILQQQRLPEDCMSLGLCSERPEATQSQGPRVMTHISQPGGQQPSTPRSKFENLPVELVNQVLSYLAYPRGHLPGLTQAQSEHDFPAAARRAIKATEDLTRAVESPHWATNLFDLYLMPHPFNALAASSRRCRQLVESHCAHLVRARNHSAFNLPFRQFDEHGPQSVYPDLSQIVYRRLWLQHAPRQCIYCCKVLENYPFRRVRNLLTTCADCFYRLTLEISEVQSQYHISSSTVTNSPHIRGGPLWMLRTDVEALALQLYRSRAFHSARVEQLGKPCSLCAITRFYQNCSGKPKSTSKAIVRLIASPKKRSSKRSPRC